MKSVVAVFASFTITAITYYLVSFIEVIAKLLALAGFSASRIKCFSLARSLHKTSTWREHRRLLDELG